MYRELSRAAIPLAGREGAPRSAFLVVSIVLSLGAGLACLLVPGTAWAQISRVQAVSGAAENGASVSATWAQATGAGRLLVASVAFTGGMQVTLTPPAAGWTLIVREDHGASLGTAIYYWQNAPSQSGAATWLLSGTNRDGTLFLMEYDGLRDAGALDVSGSAQGNTGNLGPPNVNSTQTDELAIAVGTLRRRGAIFSAPTSGFSLVGTTTTPGNGVATSFLAERTVSAVGTLGTGLAPDNNGNWVAAIATFRAAAKYWRAGAAASAQDGTQWADTSGGSAVNTPSASEMVVFDGAGNGACTIGAALSVRRIEIRSGFVGTITHAAGTAVTLSGGFSQAGGTYRNDGGTFTVAGAAQITAGTFAVGQGSNRFMGGLSTSTGAVIQLAHASGELALGQGTTFFVGGTLQATATAAVRAFSGSFAFGVGAAAILDVTALRIEDVDAAGMTIANGATFTRFRGVQFLNNGGDVLSRHLQITANALDLVMSGSSFDASAASNVRLVGNGDADGATRLTVEDRGVAISGALAGESFDDDDDNAGGGDGLGDNPGTNGAVVQWVRSAPADTAGAIVGFPTAAIDWNTFTWYSTYAAYRNVGGPNTADRVYVRTQDGDAAYAYDVVEGDGDIVGTPLWDTIDETTTGVDGNGDGDASDAALHVVYVATTTGKVIKLVDTGTALAPPGASSPWSSSFSDGAIAVITSPLVTDGNNLYFGGADGSTTPRIYAVQIAAGAGERTLVRNILAAGPIRTAPALAQLNGRSYLFVGSDAANGSAHLYRVDVATGVVDADYTGAAAHLTARVTIFGGRVHVGDAAGRLHGVDGADFAPPLFESLAGFPYADLVNHAACGGVCGISAPAYVDPVTSRIYFGDQDGHLYVVTSSGTAAPGYPIHPTSEAMTSGPLLRAGILVVGTSAGRVLLVDESAATVVRTYRFGGGAAISTVAFDASRGQYLLATDAGALFFLPSQPDPTP